MTVDFKYKMISGQHVTQSHLSFIDFIFVNVFFIGPFFNVRFIVYSVAVVLTLNVFYKMVF